MEEEDLINSSPVANTSPGPVPKRYQTKPTVKDDKFISKIFSNNPRTEYNTPLGSIAPKMSSTYHGQNTGVGQSTFDEGLLWGANIDDNDVQGSLNEYRYNQQGWGLQVGAGIARAGTKAATEILKLPGVVVGGIAAPFAAEGEGFDTAFNNQWIKSIDKLNENINTEVLPVYVGKAIKEGNLWDNITSTSFWATDGADGLGFMIAMMAPGAAINKLSVGAKLVNATSKTAKFLGMTESLEAGINGLSKAGFTGAGSIDMGLGVAANTIFEAGAEAKSVGDTMDAQKDIFIRNYPAQQLKKLQELDIRRRNGEINIDEYNRLSSEISDKTAEDSFKEQRAIAMRDNFNMNLAILLGPNILMHQTIWGKAARKVESEVAKQGTRETLQRVGRSARRWGKAFLSEGFLEEGGQSTSEKLFTNKAMRGELSRDNNFFNDFSVGELTNGYLDMISSTEGQKAVFLGGVLGGPMMSYQGRKEDLNNRRETNAILDRTNNAINSFNTIFNNDIYRKKEDGTFVYETDELGNEDTSKRIYDPKKVQEIAIANHFTEQRAVEFEQAIRDGNQDVVNEIKQQAIFDLILPSIYNRNGGLEVMRQQLKASQEFQEIVARDNIPSATEKSSKFVEDILDAVQNLQFQQEKFDNFSKDVIDLNDSRANAQDKESYLNKLSIQYLKTKFNQYNAEKAVKELSKQREELLEDLDLDRYLVLDDEIAIKLEQNNLLLRSLSDQIRGLNEVIAKSKKDVAELWSGKDLINKSFSNYIDGQLREEERLSPENVDKAQKALDDIQNATTIDELQNSIDQNKNEVIGENSVLNNPLIQDKISEKENEILVEEERVQDELEENNDSLARDAREYTGPVQDLSNIFTDVDEINIEQPSVDIETAQTDFVETENDAQTLDETDDNYEEEVTLEKPLTNITDTDIILDGNPSTTLDDEIPANGNEISKKIDKVLKSQQTGVKLVSTIRNKNSNKNGQKLDFVSQEFLDYERNGENKINTPVKFKIADYREGLAGDAIDLLDNTNLSLEDRLIIYNYLPISVLIENVETFIESKPFKGASKQANDIFEAEVLPLRKLIVDALLRGKNIEDLSSHVVKQFPGVLQVEPQILLPDGRLETPKNSIKDLQYFQNFQGNVLAEIVKRSYFVDYDGQLTSVNNRLDKKGDQHNGLGEMFLEIPQNNGKPFMLKLNYKAIDEDKAGAIFEIYKVLSSLVPTIENPNIRSMTINDFLNNVDEDIRIQVADGLANEIKLVNDLHENSTERTLDKLISYVIHQNSTNSRTKIKLNKNGLLVLGDLSPVSRITREQLLSGDPQFKQIVVDFLQKKRHNVLITKDSEATFQNPIYLNYLLDNDILSTNAVVNEPTFQGYSNIYISNNIKGINEPINSKIPTDLQNTQLNTTQTDNVTIQSNINTKKENLKNILDSLSDNDYYITHITPNSLEVFNSALRMPAGVSSTTGIITKDQLSIILNDLLEGKSPHRGYLEMFLGKISKSELNKQPGKTLQDKLENYIDENYIESSSKAELPNQLNFGYFKDGVLNISEMSNLNSIASIEQARREELIRAEENWRSNVDEQGFPKEALPPIQKAINEKYDLQLKNLEKSSEIKIPTKSEEDQVMELLDKFEDWNLDISLIDTTQSPSEIINQISKIVSENKEQTKEFKKICGL